MSLGVCVPATYLCYPFSVMSGFSNHLTANKNEDCGESIIKKAEKIHNSRQEEVQCAEPKNGENIRGENNEPKIVGMLIHNAEDRWDTVNRKEDISTLDNNEYKEKRCCDPSSTFFNKEPVACRLVCDRKKPSKKLQKEIVFWVHIFTRESKFQTCVNKESTEEPKDALEAFDKFCTH